VNLNGSNSTNTVHRAELAGIEIRYPELHTYHIQHNLLEAIIKAIRNSVTLSIKFLKVRAHTGIVGNECADQIGKHVARHPEAADTGIEMAGHEGNPFHNITWLATSTDGPNTPSRTFLMLATVINPSLTNSK